MLKKFPARLLTALALVSVLSACGVPAETAPAETATAKTAQVEPATAKPSPSKTADTKSPKPERKASEPSPGDTTPAQNAPVQAGPDDVPVQAASAEPAPAKPVQGNPAEVQEAPKKTPKAAPIEAEPAAAPANTGTMKTGFITGYTIHDNDPAGSREIAFSSQWEAAAVHDKAAGTGTYDDPITLAAQSGDYAPGTRFYLPHVDRYFILEDTCASCGEKSEWIDMWIGGTMDDSAADTDACARTLTGNFKFEVNPPRGREVASGPLYNSTTDTCYTPTP